MKKTRNTPILIFEYINNANVGLIPPNFDGDIVVNTGIDLSNSLKFNGRLYVKNKTFIIGSLECEFVTSESIVMCDKIKVQDITCDDIDTNTLIAAGNVCCDTADISVVDVFGDFKCRILAYYSRFDVAGLVQCEKKQYFGD